MNLKNGASKRALLVGASLVVALAAASSVRAACLTDNGAITCTGDNQPFAVTSDSNVAIGEGATVTGSGLTAVRLASSSITLSVDGTINAIGTAGLTIQNGDRVLVYDPYAGAAVLWPYIYPYYYPAGAATIVVGEQGKISGDTGIWVERSASNYLGASSASIDNSGLITASSGSAIRSATSDGVGYSSITNQESGTIHGIAANVSTIDNAGLIDGRDNAAISIYRGFDPYGWGSSYSTVTNSGTITSAGRATIESRLATLTLTNSGTVANSAGGLAIDATTSLYLTNTGTINGDIIARTPSRIDVRRGRSTAMSPLGTATTSSMPGSMTPA